MLPLRTRPVLQQAAAAALLKGRGRWLGRPSTDIKEPRPFEYSRVSAHELPPFVPGGWRKWRAGKGKVVREAVLNRRVSEESALAVTQGDSVAPKVVITKLDKGTKFRARHFDEVWARNAPDTPWRVSQKKLNHVLGLIRDKNYNDALTVLRLSEAKISRSLIKLLQEARVRGEDRHGFEPELLYVKEAWVSRGPILWRMMPHSKGRAGKVRKPTSHVTIILGEAQSRDDPRLHRRSSTYGDF